MLNTTPSFYMQAMVFGKLLSSDLVGEGEVAFPDQWGSGRRGGGGRGMGGVSTSHFLYLVLQAKFLPLLCWFLSLCAFT